MDNALSKFADHLRHVTLSVSDVNGPRGGKDKLCRCVLHLKRAQPVVIEDLDFSVGGAIHHALDRAVYTVSQRIAKFLARAEGLGSHRRQTVESPVSVFHRLAASGYETG